MGDHYETLGVSRTASDDVIRAAYKARIRQAHPDAGGDALEAQAVNDAYAVLSSSAARAAYDRTLSGVEPPAQPAAKDATRAAPQTRAATPIRVAEPGQYPQRWVLAIPFLLAAAATLAALGGGVVVAALAADPDEWTQPLVAAGALAAAIALALFSRSESRTYKALLIALVPGALAIMNPYVQAFVPWAAAVGVTTVVTARPR